MKAAVRLVLLVALLAPNFALAADATPAPTCTLFASATVVAPNTKVRLDWTSTNATTGYLTDIGAIPAGGYVFVVPGKNTTYTASFTGPGGTKLCAVGIVVQAGATTGSTGAVGSGTTGVGVVVPTQTGSVTLPTAPSVTSATTQTTSGGLIGGIVPPECKKGSVSISANGRTTTVDNAVANCDFCALGQLAQNIINFLIGLTIPAAALMFAWAGILFFSGRGVPEQINRAKKIFKTVLIAFAIAVAAWTLVNTVINMLVSGTTYQGWSWNTLNCQAARTARQQQLTKTLDQYITSSLPGLSSYTPSTGGAAYQCTSGTLQGGSCVDANGSVVGAPIIVSTPSGTSGGTLGPALLPNQLTDAQQDQLQDACDDGDTASCTKLNGPTVSNPQMAAQISAACQQYSSVDCKLVSSLANNESSGGNNCTTSPTGAAGCMQVLATTACGINSSISSSCSACLASKNSLSSACAPVIDTVKSDTQLGTNLGVQYIDQLQHMQALDQLRQQYGTCQITAAAYFQGPGNVLKAGGVPANAVGYVQKACG